MFTRSEASSIEVASSAISSFGPQHQRPGDHDPLPLTAGQLVRVAVQHVEVHPDVTERLLQPVLADLARPAAASSGRAAACTVKNWLNEENGSWKTACTSRQYAVRSCPSRLVTSLPWKVIVPEVIGSRPSTIRAMVDLPEPLSPTIVVIVLLEGEGDVLDGRTAFLPRPKVLVMFSAASTVISGHLRRVVEVASSGSFSPCT